MRVERFVCDTNVLISAAIVPEGKSRFVVRKIVNEARLLICAELFEELATRLYRRKFDRYVTDDDRAEFLQMVLSASEFVGISGKVLGVRDRNDDMVLETALAGAADCLVTGDTDLLVRPCGEAGTAKAFDDALFGGVAILRPAEYLSLAEAAGS